MAAAAHRRKRVYKRTGKRGCPLVFFVLSCFAGPFQKRLTRLVPQGYNGKYKPFKTVITVDYPIFGSLERYRI